MARCEQEIDQIPRPLADLAAEPPDLAPKLPEGQSHHFRSVAGSGQRADGNGARGSMAWRAVICTPLLHRQRLVIRDLPPDPDPAAAGAGCGLGKN
jgi:hypothetical protein